MIHRIVVTPPPHALAAMRNSTLRPPFFRRIPSECPDNHLSPQGTLRRVLYALPGAGVKLTSGDLARARAPRAAR